jgi:alanyl-tRNA synthetase
MERGSLKVGETVFAHVDVEKRDATRRNHTATHLMHAALREVLGTHVKQAGSVVAPTYLRFDFSHYQPLTQAEREEVERLVNYHILRNEPVQTDEMAIEEAMRSGAMALFGEKYGEKVRVLSIKAQKESSQKSFAVAHTCARLVISGSSRSPATSRSHPEFVEFERSPVLMLTNVFARAKFWSMSCPVDCEHRETNYRP